MKITSDRERHTFEVQVYFGGLDPNSIRVEIYADGEKDGDRVQHEMIRGREPVGADGFMYAVQVPSDRPVTDYTVRALPHFPGFAVPLEVARILWQR